MPCLICRALVRETCYVLAPVQDAVRFRRGRPGNRDHRLETNNLVRKYSTILVGIAGTFMTMSFVKLVDMAETFRSLMA